MPYDEWKTKYQTEQPKDRVEEFNKTHNHD